MASPPPISCPQHIHTLLSALHTQSSTQESHLRSTGQYPQVLTANNPSASKSHFDTLMRDKFIALDPDKAALVYNLLRANGALNVVEAGTSFGVSTIYLALAVGQNARARGIAPGDGTARVIATENEPAKAARAREYWGQCGEEVRAWIELREGDLRETLREGVPGVDAVLFDIWTPMALPTLKLLEPRLRPGALIVVDNVVASREGYAPFYEHVAAGGYTAVTLPYAGGLGLIVYTGSEVCGSLR